jgi:hypothetical protein
MAYEFRYQLAAAPRINTDGGGVVLFDIWAVYRALVTDPWTPVPGRHQDVQVPWSELKIVNDMPHSNASQKTAKTTALKNALANNLATVGVPVRGWAVADLQALLDANDGATLEATRVDSYLRVTLAQVYPITFSM